VAPVELEGRFAVTEQVVGNADAWGEIVEGIDAGRLRNGDRRRIQERRLRRAVLFDRRVARRAVVAQRTLQRQLAAVKVSWMKSPLSFVMVRRPKSGSR
jgi:hypothetical protein